MSDKYAKNKKAGMAQILFHSTICTLCTLCMLVAAGPFISLELDPLLLFLSLCPVCSDLAVVHLSNVGLKKED